MSMANDVRQPMEEAEKEVGRRETEKRRREKNILKYIYIDKNMCGVNLGQKLIQNLMNGTNNVIKKANLNNEIIELEDSRTQFQLKQNFGYQTCISFF